MRICAGSSVFLSATSASINCASFSCQQRTGAQISFQVAAGKTRGRHPLWAHAGTGRPTASKGDKPRKNDPQQ